MSLLFKVITEDSATKALSCDVKSGLRYHVTLQFSALDRDIPRKLEKAALLVFGFKDIDGNEIAAPKSLFRTGKGDAFIYINLSGKVDEHFDVVVPPLAVLMTMEVRPWKCKHFSAQFIRIEPVTLPDKPSSHPSYFSAVSASLLPSLTEVEASQRHFLEAMVAEEDRAKRDFTSILLPVPSAQSLFAEPQYQVGMDYLKRRTEREGKPRHLVISTSYPSLENKNASAFVHSRVRGYMAEGAAVDVVSFARGAKPQIWRHDGVDVLSGYANELMAVLAAGKYDSVSIHFLHPHMVGIIGNFINKHRFHLFLHGHGARSWSRTFDPTFGMAEWRRQKTASDLYKDMWHWVLQQPNFPESCIFISRWMRQCAEDDMMVCFPEEKVRVVHNPIDTDLFAYNKKSKAMSQKVLLIRNFDSYHAGTDMAIRSMVELRKRAVWKNLNFTIYGRGKNLTVLQELFGGDNNVTIHDTYLTPQQMQAAFNKHGIMLIPTRLDSQGVSRDEAMASGLVPVTNAVCAVPEFTDKSCAFLAPAEDHVAMADGIAHLAKDFDHFSAMSKAAAARVRAQSSMSNTIRQEAAIMGLIAETKI